MSFVERLFGEKSPLEGGIANPMAPWVSIPRIHHLLPFESYDEHNQLFYNKASTGFVLNATPLVGATLKDQDQLAHFFSQKEILPEGTAMQFLLYASPKVGEQLDYWEQHRMQGVFHGLAKKRTKFLKEKALKDEHHRLRDFRLMISYTVPEIVEGVMEIERLIKIRDHLQSLLQGIGVHSIVADATYLIQELNGLLDVDNPYKKACRWDPLTPIANQIFAGGDDFKNDRDYVLKNDEQAIRTYFPVTAPKYWSLGHMSLFLGDILETTQHIPTPFMIHYGFVVQSTQGRDTAKLEGRIDSLEKSLSGFQMRMNPDLKLELEEAREAVPQIKKHHRWIYAALSVTVLTEPKKISAIEQSLKQIWLSMGWNFEPATYDHLGAFLAALPMTWTSKEEMGLMGNFSKKANGFGHALFKMGRAKKTITREAQNMLPLIGGWKGQLTPGVPFMDRTGQLFFWNPFDGFLLPGVALASNTSNYNLAISGVSGSGKSFFCNEIINCILSTGGKALILDKGESFKNICLQFGGHHIDFKATLDVSLNPFTHMPIGNSEEDLEGRYDQMETIIAILMSMCKPRETCSSLEESFLRQAAKTVFETKSREATIHDVQQALFENPDARAHDLANMLWSFSADGPYNHLFNRPGTVDFNHDFVVIETQNLKDDLKAVVVQLMMVQGWQRMVRSNRKQPFMLLIDEAWELIQGESSGKFISAYVRTARKYRSCLALVTQNLTDFFRKESPGATEAFQNSAWKGILHQSDDATASMSEHPHLKEFVNSDFREKTIRSLLPARGFSEVAIFGQKVHGVVGRLFVDPYARLLYSTSPQDFFDIQNYVQNGFLIGDAVEQVLKDRGQL